MTLSIVPRGRPPGGARFRAGGRVVTTSTPRSLAAARAGPDARRSRFPPSRSRRCRTACGCGPCTTRRCRSWRSCCWCGAARRPIRSAKKGWPPSPPTCSTRAAAIDRRSRCTRRSRGLARSSIPTSARTRRVAERHVLSRFADRALPLLADIVARPALSEDGFRARSAAAAPSADADARRAGRGRRSHVHALLYGVASVRPHADRAAKRRSRR